MPDPIARRPVMVSGPMRATMIAGLLAGLVTAGSTLPELPPGCGIKWTRTGGVWIATPDCSQGPPPTSGPPDAPPPVAPPPGQ